MTIITDDLREKIERRSQRAWRRLKNGNTRKISRITGVTETELNYRVPDSPGYYGSEHVRVVKHVDGAIEVDPKTTGLIDCKSKDDLTKLAKHGGTIKAYAVVKKVATAAKNQLLDKHLRKKGKIFTVKDGIELQSRSQSLSGVNPGDRVFVIELHADDIDKHSYGSFRATKMLIADELDPKKDLGFTTGLIDCLATADIAKLKKHIGKIRGYVLKKREKRSLKLNVPHTLKTGERYQSKEVVIAAVRPGDKAYVAEFDYSDVGKHHIDGVSASAVLTKELDQKKDLGFTVGTLLDMRHNADIEKLRKHVGKIRGYKYVTKDLKSPTRTGPEQITYKVGDDYEIKDANTDDGSACEAGINIGTAEWCKTYCNGEMRAIAFEFESADIAAIPLDGGKMRTFRTKCVEELDPTTFDPLPKPKKAKKAKKIAKETKKKGFLGKLLGMNGDLPDEV
jgi:hypothetical protein